MMNAEILPNVFPRAETMEDRSAWRPRVSNARVTHELVERDGTLTGKVPAWLQGRLLRTAPAIFEAGAFRAAHWFDGLGMLYGFRFREGGQVSFAQRLLASETGAEAERDRMRTASFGTLNQRSFWQRVFQPVPKFPDNANVNVIRLGSEWIALTESPYQLRVDDATLDVRGRVQFDDALPNTLSPTAHPHFDFEKKAIVNLGTMLGRKAEIVAFEQAVSGGPRHEIGRYSADEAPYVHSFGVTSKSVVLVAHPWLISPLSLLWSNRGYADHFRWKPEQGTRFVVFDRAGGATRVFESEPFFTFHTVNTFEEGDETVIDLLAYPDAGVIDELRVERMLTKLTALRPKLMRVRLGRGKRAKLETLSESGFEFPIINYRRTSGRRQRYLWGSNVSGDGADVVALDYESGAIRHFGVPGYVFGEPVFVPQPGAERENDGVVLTVGSNGESSKLAVLNAQSLEPEASLHLDLPIPLGFHGSFSRG